MVPAGMLGIGVGGSAEKAMIMAKEVLNEPLDMFDLLRRGPATRAEALRVEIYDRVNALGIGAQGLGGLTTVLDVRIQSSPHACRIPAGGADPKLRRDPSRAFRTGRVGPGAVRAARYEPVAGHHHRSRLGKSSQG